jgi:hypothetical protein
VNGPSNGGRLRLLGLVLVAASPMTGAAQGLPGGLTTAGNVGALGAGIPTVRAIRASTPPEVDGRLDDEVWREAIRLTEFVQRNPDEGAPATEQTEIWIA